MQTGRGSRRSGCRYLLEIETVTRAGAPVGAGVRRAAGNAAVTSVAQVVGKVGTLVWTLVAARLLSPDDFGAFFFVLTVAMLVSPFAEWGFGAVMVRRGAGHPELLPGLFTRALAWQLSLGLPMFVLAGFLVVAARPDPAVRTAGVLLLTSVVVDLVSHTCRAAASARQRQASTSAALVGQRLGTAALSVAALVAGTGLIGLAAAQLVGALLGLVLHLRAVSGLGVRPRRSHVDRRSMRDYVRGTLLVGLSSLTMMVLFRLDSFLLGLLQGDVDVGVYAAAYRLLETVLFIAFALKSAVFPVMSATTSRTVVSGALHAGVAAMALVYVAFGTVVLVAAGPVLSLLYGEPFATSSVPALQWLAPAPLLFAVAYLGNAALQAVDRTGAMFGTAAAAAVLNLGLNLLLIPRHGPSGAAAATTLSFAFQCLLQQVLLTRTGIRSRPWRAPLEPLVAATVLAGVLVVLPAPVAVTVPVGGVLYLAVWALLVRHTAPEQLAVIRSVLDRRRRAA